MPAGLVVISIDEKRLEAVKLQLHHLSETVLRGVDMEKLIVVTRNGKRMYQNGSLHQEMEKHGWSDEGSLTQGEIGCSLAHLEGIRIASQQSSPTIIIEDDMLVLTKHVGDFHRSLMVALASSGAVNWGVLRMGCHKAPPDDPLRKMVQQLHHTSTTSIVDTHLLTTRTKMTNQGVFWGSYMYCVTKRGAGMILETLRDSPDNLQYPHDVWISLPDMVTKVGVYALTPPATLYRKDVVSTTRPPDGESVSAKTSTTTAAAAAAT